MSDICPACSWLTSDTPHSAQPHLHSPDHCNWQLVFVMKAGKTKSPSLPCVCPPSSKTHLFLSCLKCSSSLQQVSKSRKGHKWHRNLDDYRDTSHTLPNPHSLHGMQYLASRNVLGRCAAVPQQAICMQYRLQLCLKAFAYRREPNSCRQVFGFSRKESEVRALPATIRMLKNRCIEVCTATSDQQSPGMSAANGQHHRFLAATD